MRWKTTRGLFSAISGSVGVSQEMRTAVGATVAEIAGTEQAVFVGGHLQRGELGVALEHLRRDLVHGDGVLELGVRLLYVHAGEVRAASAGVVAAAVAERFRLIAEQARDDDQLVLEWLAALSTWVKARNSCPTPFGSHCS